MKKLLSLLIAASLAVVAVHATAAVFSDTPDSPTLTVSAGKGGDDPGGGGDNPKGGGKD